LLPENGNALKLDPVDVAPYERALEDSFSTSMKLGLNMLRMLPGTSLENQSAESTAQEKENLYALVDSSLEDIENVVNEAIEYAALYKGIKDFESDVKFDRAITEQSTTEFVSLAQAFMDKLTKYPQAGKELLMRAATQLQLSEEAIKEIEENGVQQEESPETERQALIDEVINGKQ
jgi:hypothetical protein